MGRRRQPAMNPAASGARPDDGRPDDRSANDRSPYDGRAEDRRAKRADDPSLHEERGRGGRALTRGWALTRWVGLILLIGFGVALVVAIAMGALAALVNSSV